MADRFTLERGRHAGREALRLRDANRDLTAVFLPGLGMVGASLTHRGEELLGRVDQLEAYATKGSTVGIPLLHPWANRLAGYAYEAAGRRVELDPSSPLLHRDANGLPIHGVLAASPDWSVVDEGDAEFGAELDFGARDELLAVFPFPHTLRLDVGLDGDGLTIATTIAVTGDVPVPVSFGFHPYLRLPDVPRAEWRVELPSLRRLVLDDRMIPTGEAEPFAFPPGRLGDAVLDDGFAGADDGTVFALAGGTRRIEVRFLDGYPFAQAYAPGDLDVVCFEPMTAPTNALASGDGLRLVEPGGRFRAAFRLSVTDL